MTDELEKIIIHRGNAYKSSRNSITMIEDADEIINKSNGERSMSLFCKSVEFETINLEDFQLISVIGRGNFGKVYLVFLPRT